MFKNYYHYSSVRKIRSISRKLGLLKLIKPFLAKRQKSYEEAFHAALKDAVAIGDTVWDVGANVGLYTNHFLDWVGAGGEVVAFEPLPSAFQALSKNVSVHAYKDRAVLECLALSDQPGQAAFFGDNQEGENVTTTAHLAHVSEAGSGSGITVNVDTADLVVGKRGLPLPNVVKIDVEGFEENVLLGGEQTFNNPSCRHLLIEMHFTRMDERNLGDSASRIVAMLKRWGYKVQWVDASHLHASR